MDENQCRTCLGEAYDTRLSICKRVNGVLIEEMIEKVTNSQIRNSENFSKILCKQCFNDVCVAYNFRDKFLKTEKTLRGLEKKLLEIQNQQERQKQEEEFLIDTSVIVKKEDELMVPDSKQMELVELDADIIEEIQEGENLISYEIEEEENGEQFLEAYEHVEYLESEVTNDEKYLENYTETSVEKAVCLYCDPPIAFESNLRMKIHLFQRHKIGENPLSCTLCNLEFELTPGDDFMEGIIEQHFKDHTEGRSLTCKLCFELFQTQAQLELHLNLYHKKNSKSMLKCKRCNTSFSTKVELSVHVATTECKENHEKAFQCYICNKMFSMGITKKQHIIQDHQDKAATDCPLCLRCKIPSAIAFENHYRTHFVAARFCCSYCGRSFHESDRLQTHIRRSHENTKLICFWCKKTFRDKSGIARHILGVHFNERNFKCSICWKAFTANYNLKEHMFAVHKTASKYYTCESCSTDFLYRKQFERHRIICTGQLHKPKKRL